MRAGKSKIKNTFNLILSFSLGQARAYIILIVYYRSYAQYREPRFSPFKKYLPAKIFFFYFYSTH